MITEDYVSFETAKLLKEKGFNEPIRCWYNNFQDFHEEGVRMSNTDCLPPTIMCPTHQMAMKWLRDEKYISIVIDDEIPLSYKYIIKKYSINKDYRICVYKEESLPFVKYEYTVDAAIKYCLENLI